MMPNDSNNSSTDNIIQDPRARVALAILCQDGKFLMQLRDDYPHILYPGHWGFFGGHLEPGETPEQGVKRELVEEIGYCPPTLIPYHLQADSQVIRHVYYGNLEVDLSKLVLTEGMDLDLLTPEDIQRGDRYSTRIGQVRPLGAPHRQILLEFIERFGSKLKK
ncbi:ADP-ribose pyrophosphatase [Leptolyngbyaceae cyanobacterium JSC-12]|nr:ADP-ribose pyrophosphatase [Leptolyngbyaceae cyanobacterium JSC-12]